ncbi:MAG: alpha/beta family hydrolase [Cyanobium sp.]
MEEQNVTIAVQAGSIDLPGTLIRPGNLVKPGSSRGLVIFAHGSGSSRFSSRNRFVADQLVGAGLATLLFDLLTAEEDGREHPDQCLRFDIPLLSARLEAAIRWAIHQPELTGLPVGLFGASTGAAAAINAAVACSEHVAAVVSRGGRPDLAFNALPAVTCPTLFIVGGSDVDVLELNIWAAAHLQARHHLEVVPGATHLFGEPGALQRATELARDWFVDNLKPSPTPG